MSAPARPDELTPQERLEGIAAILARGVLRLKESRGIPAKRQPENLHDSRPDRLELFPATRLNVVEGLTP